MLIWIIISIVWGKKQRKNEEEFYSFQLYSFNRIENDWREVFYFKRV